MQGKIRRNVRDHKLLHIYCFCNCKFSITMETVTSDNSKHNVRQCYYCRFGSIHKLTTRYISNSYWSWVTSLKLQADTLSVIWPAASEPSTGPTSSLTRTNIQNTSRFNCFISTLTHNNGALLLSPAAEFMLRTSALKSQSITVY